MSSSHKGARLLVLDDEPGVCDFIAEVANAAGYRCLALSDPVQFEAALGIDPALIILDLMMPGIDGIELLRLMAKRNCGAPIALMSGYDKRVLLTAEELARTLGLKILGRFEKPIRLTDLEAFFAQQVAGHAIECRSAKARPTVSASELARAIREQELVLHYQPQIDVASGRLIGIESLVRWQHPRAGLVYPDAFIGIAEDSGVIDDLGWAVLRRGIGDYGSFMGGLGDISLSVNVSARSLHDLSLPDRLADLADEQGVPRSNVVLEITESGLARELDKALDILTRLRMKGMQLSIDDFGTGYSMMQQLRLVPASAIKIDGAFVRDIGRDDNARVVVEKTIEIGHELGMRVTAQGVETRAQLDFLKGRGCDAAQGCFICRPLPAAAFLSWAQRWRDRR